MKVDSGTFVAVLTFVTFIFAIVGTLGTWRASKSTAALNQYRETAQAWEGRSRSQTMQIASLQDDAKAKDRAIAELEGKVKVLQDALTGRAAWEILEARIGEAMTVMNATRADVAKMKELLSQGHP